MDFIIRNLIAGTIAGSVYTIINFLLFMAGVLPSTLTHYTAKLVMPPGTPITSLTLIMGATGDLAASFTGAILIDLLLRWTGREYSWLKGLSTGGVLWVIHVAFIPAIAPKVLPTLPPSMVVASFFLSILWGLIASLTLSRLPQPLE